MPADGDNLTERLLKQREEIDRFTRDALQKMQEQNERQRKALGPSHERILEYFWNPSRKEERHELPISVVYFFESSNSPHSMQMLNESGVNVLISELVAKGYISRTKRKPDQFNFLVREEEILVLTTQGLKFLL